MSTRTAHRRGESGSSLIEFSMVILPLFALLFLMLDVAWALFVKACMLESVREAVRAGITGQVQSGTSLNASIQQAAQRYSFGFINSRNVSSVLTINYYSPTNTNTALSGCGATTGGNVLQVSINGYSLVPLAPLWRSATPLTLSVSSSDVMEPGSNVCP